MENKHTLLFQINPVSGAPIYKQLIAQVSRFIVSGLLVGGDEMPSVRQLALALDINPMTISKAYGILEATGMLERRRGRGMFVSEQHQGNKSISERLDLVKPELRETVLKVKQLKISDNEFINLLKELLKENSDA